MSFPFKNQSNVPKLGTDQRELYVVQVIAIIDAIMAVFSFSFFLALMFFMGNHDEQALMSPANFFLVGGKDAAKHLTDENRQAFRLVFASIVILIAMAIHTVEIFMAWILYRAVRNIKQDQVHSLKTFERWRSWSVILLILLITGIIAFSFGLFGQTRTRWIIVTFLLTQMSFQMIAINYIGRCARRQRISQHRNGRSVSVISTVTTTDPVSLSHSTGTGTGTGAGGRPLSDKVDWKILYDL